MTMATRTDSMTNRERIRATLRGDEVDRFPVWLKMANRTWQSPQPEPYCSMGAVELLRAAGCDVMVGCGLPGKAVKTKRPYTKQLVETTDTDRTIRLETPDGVLTSVDAFDADTRSWHPISYFAETLDDFRALRWHFRDTEYSVDSDLAAAGFERQKQLESDDIFTTSGVGPAPLMNLVESMCGPQACMYHMFDAPELFEEVLELMHQDRLRYLRATLPYCPSDTFWLFENTSTSLISPTMFRDYCMPHLKEYGNLIIENEITPVHHMCGTLNALLEMIDELPAVANEAYTTRPLGDTSLAEGRKRMPNKVLIGGTNATLWLEQPDTIVQTVAADLAACPDRRKIFLTSAGVLPSPVDFNKARTVVAGLKRLTP